MLADDPSVDLMRSNEDVVMEMLARSPPMRLTCFLCCFSHYGLPLIEMMCKFKCGEWWGKLPYHTSRCSLQHLQRIEVLRWQEQACSNCRFWLEILARSPHSCRHNKMTGSICLSSNMFANQMFNLLWKLYCHSIDLQFTMMDVLTQDARTICACLWLQMMT